MYVLVSPDEIHNAPASVQEWFGNSILTAAPVELPSTDQKKREPEDKKEANPEPEEETEVSKAVLEAAVAFVNEKGEDALQGVLDKHEVKRVRECPPEKLSALLADIALT